MKKDVVKGVSFGLRSCTLWSSGVEAPGFRLDAKHYQEEFVLAKHTIAHCGHETVLLKDKAVAFVPNRAKLVFAKDRSGGAPYLRAHDAFELRPLVRRYVSQARMRNYKEYLLDEGMILTPSSGRNLGPIAYVGKYLAQYAMTDIMRIVTKDSEFGFYLYTYLLTSVGQAMIRKGRTGTNIDHLSPADVHSIPLVILDKKKTATIIANIKKSQKLLDEARMELDSLELEYHNLCKLPLPPPPGRGLVDKEVCCFTASSKSLSLRLDAAFYNPNVAEPVNKISKKNRTNLATAARLVQLGRYKRYYVAPPNGSPILSGRHLFQLRQVNLQNISDRSFKNPSDFEISTGWTLFTCDGRAEEQLGSPAFVHSGWNGWKASNHVMRAMAKGDIHPGYLYLAIRSPYTQLQIKARATGSVVDALDPETLSDVVIPTLSSIEMRELGEKVANAWEKIAESQSLESKTVSYFEKQIADGYEKQINK